MYPQAVRCIFPRLQVSETSQTADHFARFAEHHHHKLVQAEINPLAILPEGKGVKILDALIEIKEN